MTSARTTRARLLAAATIVLGELAARRASGEPRPLRIDYEAADACPRADVFLDEIRWRTALARVANATEPVLDVRARVTRRAAMSHGHLELGDGPDRIVRDIDGESCDEVVSALALVTALAIDPHARTAAKPPPPPPPDLPPLPPPLPPPPWSPPPPRILADPLPVIPASAPVTPIPSPKLWVLGARMVAELGVSPRALLGGGLFLDRTFEAPFRPSVRIGLDAAATSAFPAGPGSVWFLRAVARVDGCVFEWRPTSWLSAVPCLQVQGGALHAEGVLAGSLTFVRQTTIGWVATGIVPRIGVDLGPVVLDLRGGIILPLVRHSFTFQDPAYTIYTVPPVGLTLGLGLGGHFS